MRALVQRVRRASVTVDDVVVGAIGPGLCVLVGVTHDDDTGVIGPMATKLANLRIFDDDDGVMNRSVLDTGGEVLVVSQFTLYGDARKGRRPSWTAAAAPEVAEPLIDQLVEALRDTGLTVATGRFRADMAVELVNDGPVTLLVEIDH
ncbi:MAG: D-aminoacyl-tRNA deacylase [Acidimicrobiales bacterium]